MPKGFLLRGISSCDGAPVRMLERRGAAVHTSQPLLLGAVHTVLDSLIFGIGLIETYVWFTLYMTATPMDTVAHPLNDSCVLGACNTVTGCLQ
jgi:hypothetical protein